MRIPKIEKYVYNGREYHSIEAVQGRVESDIGAIIDRMDVTLTPKQRLNIFDTLVRHRVHLVALLTVEIETDEGYENILNIGHDGFLDTD